MLKYKETSLQIFVPNKKIDETIINELFEIIHRKVSEMFEENTFKSFHVNSTVASNIEIKGEFFSTYSINGFFPPHTTNSVLNLLKFVVINIGGKLALNHAFIDDLEIKWENFKTSNIVFKMLKANERIELDIEHQKKCFDEFCDIVQNI